MLKLLKRHHAHSGLQAFHTFADNRKPGTHGYTSPQAFHWAHKWVTSQLPSPTDLVNFSWCCYQISSGNSLHGGRIILLRARRSRPITAGRTRWNSSHHGGQETEREIIDVGWLAPLTLYSVRVPHPMRHCCPYSGWIPAHQLILCEHSQEVCLTNLLSDSRANQFDHGPWPSPLLTTDTVISHMATYMRLFTLPLRLVTNTIYFTNLG